MVKNVTRRGKKKKLLTPMTFSLIHATDFADCTEHNIKEYESMVEEFGLVVIDASLSIEQQQTRMRQVVADGLTGVKKTWSTTWIDLASLARESQV